MRIPEADILYYCFVCCDRKFIRVLLVGQTDVQLRLSDWQLVTNDVTLVCLNNTPDHFVRHVSCCAVQLYLVLNCLHCLSVFSLFLLEWNQLECLYFTRNFMS